MRLGNQYATPLIWGGLAGLLATGAFLSPHLENPMTDVKLGAVLVLSLNMKPPGRLPTRKAARDAQITIRGPDLGCAKEYAQRNGICASKTNAAATARSAA